VVGCSTMYDRQPVPHTPWLHGAAPESCPATAAHPRPAAHPQPAARGNAGRRPLQGAAAGHARTRHRGFQTQAPGRALLLELNQGFMKGRAVGRARCGRGRSWRRADALPPLCRRRLDINHGRSAYRACLCSLPFPLSSIAHSMSEHSRGVLAGRGLTRAQPSPAAAAPGPDSPQQHADCGAVASSGAAAVSWCSHCPKPRCSGHPGPRCPC